MYFYFKKELVRFSILFFIVLFVFLPSIQAHATAPSILSYQGRLTDSSGNLLGGSSGTSYFFKFSFWDNSSVGSGSKVWPLTDPDSVSLVVKEGVFNVKIGDTDNSYPDILDYNFGANQDVYLQVEVSTNNSVFETLGPRQQITPQAYAQTAGSANSINSVEQSSFGTTTALENSIVTIQATSSATTALTLLAALGQTANILDIFNSNNESIFSINSEGGLSVDNFNTTSATSTDLFATFLHATNFISENATSTNLFATNLVADTFKLSNLNGLLFGTDGDVSTVSTSTLFADYYTKSQSDGLYDLFGTATTGITTHEGDFDHSLIASALQSESDPFYTAWDKSTGISITESQITDLQSYLTSFTESDPIYSASSWFSTANNASNWNTAFGWGNHATEGYLTSYTETDPIFLAHQANNITSGDITNLANLSGTNTGDQDLSGYLNKSTDDTDDITEGSTNLFSQWTTATGGINYAGGNVGIGTTNPTSKLFINGTEDIVQNIVKGHSTQTENLAEWQDSAGNIVARINTDSKPFEVFKRTEGSVGNVIPTMTSNTTPSGVASASTELSSSYSAWYAFAYNLPNGNTQTWVANTNSGWLRYQFPVPRTIVSYDITNRNEASPRAPKNWTFEASNDGTSWTVLDTQANSTTGWLTTGGTTLSINVSNTNAYTYYRINISPKLGDSYVGIGRLEMFEEEGASYYESAFAVHSTGSVGIGTTTPSEKLGVVGNIFASGTVLGSNLSGTNTGDQDISGLVSYTNASTSVDLGAYNLSSTRNFTGPGTALLPAYSFTGDTNTGLWSPTADTLAWSTGGVERMRINSSGNVGIGTTNPGAKLEITVASVSEKNLRIEGITSQSGALIELKQGPSSASRMLTALSSAGTEVAYISNLGAIFSNVSLSAPIVSATGGTASTPNFSFGAPDPDSGMFRVSNEVIGFSTGGTERLRIDSSGNVGIGTTTPSALLSIAGTTRIDSDLRLYGSVTTSNYSELQSTTDTSNGSLDALYIVPPVNQSRIFFGKSGKTAYALNFNNVSIFENVPARLSLNSTTIDGISGSIITSAGTYLMLEAPVGAGNGYISSRDSATASRNSLAFIFHGNDSDLYKRSAGFIFAGKETSANWTSPHTIWTNNTEATNLMTLSNEGNLGIGTTTPSQKLDVNGNIQIPTTTSTVGALYQNGVRFIHSSGGASNFFAGQGAGNFTVTGLENVSVGNDTLTALTSGAANMAFGKDALKLVTTGNYNVGIGRQSLKAITTGSSNTGVGNNTFYSLAGDAGVNTAIGAAASFSAVNGSANVAIGGSALYNNVPASNAQGYNTAVGYAAGYSHTTGQRNISLGALTNFSGATTYNDTIVLGYNISATASNQINIGNTIFGNSSTGNVGIGTAATAHRLEVNGNLNFATIPTHTSSLSTISQGGVRVFHTTSSSGNPLANVFAGGYAGNLTTNSYNNTGVGNYALNAITTGFGNTALGTNALSKVTTGNFNFGLGGGLNITTGASNVAVGRNSLANTTTSSNNVAIGDNALAGASGLNTISGNVGIGSLALYGAHTGANNNIGIGYGSGWVNGTNVAFTSGVGNILIGASSGVTVDGINRAVAIGFSAQAAVSQTFIVGGLPNGSGEYPLNIGAGTRTPSAKLHLVSTTEQFRSAYDASNYWNATTNSTGLTTFNAVGTSPIFAFTGGNVGIGTTTPTQALSVVGNAQFTAVSSGVNAFDIGITSDGTLTTAASDERLKENILELDSASTLDKIMQLRPSSFDWKSNGSSDIGLIAQEVEDIFPELVFTNPTDGFKGINYSRLPALLISAVQELTNKVMSLFDGTGKANVKELCIEDVCINKDDLLNILNNGTSSTSVDVPPPADDTDPPPGDTDSGEENASSTDDVVDDTDSTTETATTTDDGTDEIIPDDTPLDGGGYTEEEVIEDTTVVDEPPTEETTPAEEDVTEPTQEETPVEVDSITETIE